MAGESAPATCSTHSKDFCRHSIRKLFSHNTFVPCADYWVGNAVLLKYYSIEQQDDLGCTVGVVPLLFDLDCIDATMAPFAAFDRHWWISRGFPTTDPSNILPV